MILWVFRCLILRQDGLIDVVIVVVVVVVVGSSSNEISPS